MFFDEDDELFGGSPKSKFFDILYNANRNLVEFELEKMVERFLVYEQMLELRDADFMRKVDSYILEHPDELKNQKNDFFIHFVGDVLSNNE